MAFVIIHLVTPLVGLLLFLLLIRKMRRERIPRAPVPELFCLFATYGGVLMVALTQLFWHWSGMASLGTFYLAIGAPIVLIVIAYRQYPMRDLSPYHGWAFLSSILYFVIAPLAFFILSRFTDH